MVGNAVACYPLAARAAQHLGFRRQHVGIEQKGQADEQRDDSKVVNRAVRQDRVQKDNRADTRRSLD
jgi:hypothetical protein